MLGYPDVPIELLDGELGDKFNIKNYVDALSDFILNCDTPMTIAIQGDWGSGKTSFMNIIRNNINDKVVTAFFNTWQFSQFNMGDELTISFLRSLIDSLNIKNQDLAAKIQKTLLTIGRFIQKGIAAGLELTPVGGLGAVIDKGVDGALSGHNQNHSISDAILELKAQFQECVKTALSQSNKHSVVVFVDDLDRLNPGKAVELLEVLKLFLDCRNCVFVLAIDYTVVTQGIKQKYGLTIDEDKGKSFFDKIIQLPFKMPVELYDINLYLIKMLESMAIQSDDKTLSHYNSLLSDSIGRNPRSIKRLFNAFVLTNKIVASQSTNNKSQQLLFATLCMQHGYEKAYNYLVSNRNDLKVETLLEFLLPDEHFTNNWSEKLGISDQTTVKFSGFIQTVIDIIDDDGKEGVSDAEFYSFKQALAFSTITSADSRTVSAASDDVKSKQIRYSFNGITYVSRSRQRQNIGYLAHDIIVEYAKQQEKMQLAQLIELLRGNWKGGWLRQIIITDAERIELSDEDKQVYLLDESDCIDYNGVKIYIAKYWGANDIEKLKKLIPQFQDRVIAVLRDFV